LVPGSEWASLLRQGGSSRSTASSRATCGSNRSSLPKIITSSICTSARSSSSPSGFAVNCDLTSALRAARPASTTHPSGASTPSSVAVWDHPKWGRAVVIGCWLLLGAGASRNPQRAASRRGWGSLLELTCGPAGGFQSPGSGGPTTGYPARAPTGPGDLLSR
jgi:hypothetical protein